MHIINLGDEAPVPEDGIKPTFTERPVIRQSEDGGNVTFECRCVGDPKPTVTWYELTLMIELNTVLCEPIVYKQVRIKSKTLYYTSPNIMHNKTKLSEVE